MRTPPLTTTGLMLLALALIVTLAVAVVVETGAYLWTLWTKR